MWFSWTSVQGASFTGLEFSMRFVERGAAGSGGPTFPIYQFPHFPVYQFPGGLISQFPTVPISGVAPIPLRPPAARMLKGVVGQNDAAIEAECSVRFVNIGWGAPRVLGESFPRARFVERGAAGSGGPTFPIYISLFPSFPISR